MENWDKMIMKINVFVISKKNEWCVVKKIIDSLISRKYDDAGMKNVLTD